MSTGILLSIAMYGSILAVSIIIVDQLLLVKQLHVHTIANPD